MARFIGAAIGKTPAETVKTGSDILKDRKLFPDPVKGASQPKRYSARPFKGTPTPETAPGAS